MIPFFRAIKIVILHDIHPQKVNEKVELLNGTEIVIQDSFPIAKKKRDPWRAVHRQRKTNSLVCLIFDLISFDAYRVHKYCFCYSNVPIIETKELAFYRQLCSAWQINISEWRNGFNLFYENSKHSKLSS